jgi:signal transduction histidine kinase
LWPLLPWGLDSQLRTGKTVMNRLRAEVATNADAKSMFALQQRAEITRLVHRGEVVDVAGLALGLLGGLVGISLFAAGIGRRVSAAAANAHRLGEGQPLVPSPVARDELGRLEIALDRTEEVLSRRGAEVVVARDEALAASQAKTRFLSRSSHELRTPLNAMLRFGQLLEFSDLRDEHRDSVAHILTAGRHLSG